MATARGAGSLPPEDGNWYLADRPVRFPCSNTRCRHKEIWDRPALMAYVAALDHGGVQDLRHPGWSSRGWLSWWDCPSCNDERFITVDGAAVRSWGVAVWHAHATAPAPPVVDLPPFPGRLDLPQ